MKGRIIVLSKGIEKKNVLNMACCAGNKVRSGA